jgi:hypothetical protein
MKIIMAGALASMLILTACGTEAPRNNGIDVIEPASVTNYEKYEWAGKIVGFEAEGVHIMSGDVIDIFKVDNENDFYLSQEVGVMKGEEGKLSLEDIKETGFDINHTNMGHMISEVTGKVEEVTEKYIKVNGKKYNTYETQDIVKGTNVTVEYLNFGEGDNVVSVHNNDFVINITISEISRGENGAMLLSGKDKDGGEYNFAPEGRLMFDISELEVGDTLGVYATSVMESYPMQLNASKMIKIENDEK